MLDKLYVKMIAEDLEPFRKGEHSGFQAFVKALDSKYEIVSTTHLKNKLIPEYYNDIKEKLQEAVNKAKYISLTTDMWTSIATEGILAITCHFVHEGKLIAPLLSTVKVEGHHTANIIANVIDEILIAWNIRHKVVAIVTDNAQNMINVAEILKIRHLPCFAHTLNLAVQDSFKIPGFEIIINKCKKVVTFFRSSTLAADTLRLIQTQNNKKTLKLIQEVNTRWNSLFYMLERLQLVKNELAVAISECPKAPPLLTAEEYEVIKETITILKPFEVATELISGEQYITSSLIIPLIRGISTKLATLEGSINTEVGLQVIESLKSSMLKRFTPYERRTPTIIATIINPKYKKRGFKTDGDAGVAMDLLQKEYTLYLNSHTPTPVPVETVDATSKDPKETSKINDLLGFLNVPQASTALSNAIIDIRQYIEKPVIGMSECPIEYWKNSNNSLKEIAFKYLSIPGSSVPSERVFSKAGQIMTDRRNRLKANKLNEMLFLKENISIFDKFS